MARPQQQYDIASYRKMLKLAGFSQKQAEGQVDTQMRMMSDGFNDFRMDWVEHRADMRQELGIFKADMKVMVREEIAKALSGVDGKFLGLDTRLSDVDSKVLGLDARLSGVDSKVLGLDARLSGEVAALRKDLVLMKNDLLLKLGSMMLGGMTLMTAVLAYIK